MRLDRAMVERGLAESRSKATDLIRSGLVELNKKVIRKPNQNTSVNDSISVLSSTQYVSRAAKKLASVANDFELDFSQATVLDVGSSTGGFTDYALQHGAKKVVAVDVGTDQLHPKLRADARVELHEKTDIREFKTKTVFDFIVVDVSFISITEILNDLYRLASSKTKLVVMVKPQFETGKKHKGVVKNNTIRRAILKEVEAAFLLHFLVRNKKDSEISGAKGNVERFYLLEKAKARH